MSLSSSSKSILLAGCAAILLTLSPAACRDRSPSHAPGPSLVSSSSSSSESVRSAAPSRSAVVPPAAPSWEPPDDAQVEQVEVPGDLPAFVVRGNPEGRRIAFLHGLCGNPYGYAWSFRNAAARRGTLVAIQGNMPCTGAFRDWSSAPGKVDARIEAAFRAAGDLKPLEDVILIGYSSGGTYAELLAMNRPERYTRLILIANPRKPALFRLRRAKAVVVMAGERDRHDLMKEGLRDLTGAGIPSTFMVLPKATHGEMGPDSERVMAEALDWFEKR